MPGEKVALLQPLEDIVAMDSLAERGACDVRQAGSVEQRSALALASLPPEASFGARLSAVARAQTNDFVVYSDTYRRISYPMGDVSPFFGVCSDVVVRAYRALGIDLQALVHQTRSGVGDTNIDHRRVEVLRRLFVRFGQSIPVTDFAEDYLPGDIVTYHRPQNRHSRSHIAIVTDVVAPSGRPMIVHNRGWGPQLEDGLFVDQITGHYRFSGLDPAVVLNPPVSPRAGGLLTLRKVHARRPAPPSGKSTATPGSAAAPRI